MLSVQHSVDHVVEIAQCDREMAARVLLASRGDVGLAIGRIIESQASGGAETTAARPSELELELGLTDLDSGAQLSPTLLAQQQALLVSRRRSFWPCLLYCVLWRF